MGTVQLLRKGNWVVPRENERCRHHPRAKMAAGQKARLGEDQWKSSTEGTDTCQGVTKEKGNVTGNQGQACSGDESTLGGQEKGYCCGVIGMECVELFTVTATFLLNRNGVHMLVLHPDFSVPKAGWKHRVEVVTIVTPDGNPMEATAEFSMSHFNIYDPNASMVRRWRVTVLLTGVTKAEIPVGSVVWVSPTTRDALVTQESESE